MDEEQSLEQPTLQECVFNNDVAQLATLLTDHDVDDKDRHGNTALHLAAMLGRTECINILLEHDPQVEVENLNGWSPLAEAISYGDRDTILALMLQQNKMDERLIAERRPKMAEALCAMADFTMEMKWEFQCWVPLVSRLLPSDVCRIRKRGGNVRVDTTLVDFKNMRWEHGDISYVFNTQQPANHLLTILDNVKHCYTDIVLDRSPSQHARDADLLMTTENFSTRMTTEAVTFSRVKTGWFFKEERRETVGAFKADVYDVVGLEVDVRLRGEHLDEEEMRDERSVVESLMKATTQQQPTSDAPHRPSLTPPADRGVTWTNYITSPAGEHPHLGRDHVLKHWTRTVKATLAMCPDFPLTVDMLLNILSSVSSVKRFGQLRDFILLKMPPGFPVKLDVPIVPMLAAKVTFQEFAFDDDIGEEIFQKPAHYRDFSRVKRNRKLKKETEDTASPST